MTSGIISGILLGGFLILLVYVLGRVISGPARQTETIRLNASYSKVLDLCVDSLHRIARSRVVEKDISQGRVVARTKPNWKTWGDTIVFDVKGFDGGNVEVTVLSKPTLFTTLADYGKNAENVKKICEFLRNNERV